MLSQRRSTKSCMSASSVLKELGFHFTLMGIVQILCVDVSLLHVNSCLGFVINPWTWNHTQHGTQPLQDSWWGMALDHGIHRYCHTESHPKASSLVQCWTSLYTSEEIHEKKGRLICGLSETFQNAYPTGKTLEPGSQGWDQKWFS